MTVIEIKEINEARSVICDALAKADIKPQNGVGGMLSLAVDVMMHYGATRDDILGTVELLIKSVEREKDGGVKVQEEL